MKIHSVIGVQKLLSTLTFLRYIYLVLRERGIDSLPYGEEAYSFDTATSMTKSTIFATHEKDIESGLYHARNRMYDSASGRFTSVDPIKDSLNWFIYCDADPVNRVDPSGLKSLDYMDAGISDPETERQRDEQERIIQLQESENRKKQIYELARITSAHARLDDSVRNRISLDNFVKSFNEKIAPDFQTFDEALSFLNDMVYHINDMIERYGPIPEFQKGVQTVIDWIVDSFNDTLSETFNVSFLELSIKGIEYVTDFVVLDIGGFVTDKPLQIFIEDGLRRSKSKGNKDSSALVLVIDNQKITNTGWGSTKPDDPTQFAQIAPGMYVYVPGIHNSTYNCFYIQTTTGSNQIPITQQTNPSVTDFQPYATGIQIHAGYNNGYPTYTTVSEGCQTVGTGGPNDPVYTEFMNAVGESSTGYVLIY